MVAKRYLKSFVDGDTFAWKIDSKDYPLYNGRYLIFVCCKNTLYEKRASSLVFRVKITSKNVIPKTQEEIDTLENIKMYCENYAVLEAEYPEVIKELVPDEYGFVYHYVFLILTDRVTKPSAMQFIGNYAKSISLNEFYPPLNWHRFSYITFCEVELQILMNYELYNKKKYIGFTKDGYQKTCEYLMKSEQIFKEVRDRKISQEELELYSKEKQRDNLTYVGFKEENYKE